MKIAYAGFDLMYSAMESLSEHNKIMKLFTCAVDGVYETNDKVIALADRLGAPHTTDRISQSDIDALIRDGCELLVSAGYYYLIPVDGRLPMVNIHPSLLPYGRGAWPMPLAILDRLPESGVTVHKTEVGFDTGDILLQRSFKLAEDETLDSFMDKVNAYLPDMMGKLTADLDSLWNNARPQGEGEYQTQPDPEDYVLSAEDTVKYADRVLRAFYGFPCYYRDENGMHTLLRCRAYHGGGEGYPLKDGYIK
ncbi:MAG: hypothetical protein IJV48_03555 [Ruminococcus sp.]|nr:hypothetical protein [Ruminococcus sp.]